MENLLQLGTVISYAYFKLEGRSTKKIPTNDLMELARLVLDNNEFQFEGESFVQREGTAIGSKLGKNYACAYMGEWEKEVNG